MSRTKFDQTLTCPKEAMKSRHITEPPHKPHSLQRKIERGTETLWRLYKRACRKRKRKRAAKKRGRSCFLEFKGDVRVFFFVMPFPVSIIDSSAHPLHSFSLFSFLSRYVHTNANTDIRASQSLVKPQTGRNTHNHIRNANHKRRGTTLRHTSSKLHDTWNCDLQASSMSA